MNNGIWRKAAGNRTEIVEKWETTDKKYDKNYFLENGGGALNFLPHEIFYTIPKTRTILVRQK